MKRNLLTATGVAATLSLALLAGAPAFAQADAGTFTTANVDPADPFGPIDVDTAIADVPAFLAGLSAETRLEIEQRCVVISGNATLYDAQSVAFCAVVAAGAAVPAVDPVPATPPTATPPATPPA